ncbi:enoyl-CoA hydratase/isomerase family protein [Pseudonocardia sp. N23]|uniref:enoyl-CoA hydratase/isomerase family protein n=1 Tax=Pseudonocardia sp. N23 TaxID=1987376 RepID=UPI001145CA48|nr:enoyl-CoA hydratase-related protein [Pseudonocardia sp. N23]
MTDDLVLLDRAGATATITLNRPGALNALTPEMLDRLAARLDEAAADEAVRIVVLTGAGRAFCAGVDLKALGQLRIVDGAVGDVLDVPARAVITRLTSMPKLVLARIQGACFTGGLEIALGCDLLVAADEAKFGDTHAKFGLRPSWGMSQRLIRLVGVARARQLSYTAATFTGAQAAAWGMVTRSAPLTHLDSAVGDLVDSVLANSQGSLAAYKDLYAHALDGAGLADGLAYESATGYPIPDTEERVAGFR